MKHVVRAALLLPLILPAIASGPVQAQSLTDQINAVDEAQQRNTYQALQAQAQAEAAARAQAQAQARAQAARQAA
ncbi:hypothetical protein, partial [Acetobacter peroxydans]